MGIQNLNQLLTKKCPHVFVQRPITYFKNQRIAIDSNNYLYSRMANAHVSIVRKTDIAVQDPNPEEVTKLFCQLVLDTVLEWLDFGITPIFVFDGEYPVKKTATKLKRMQARDKLKTELSEMVKNLRDQDILSKNAVDIEKVRQKMNNVFVLSNDNINLVRDMLTGLGVTCLQAKGEGEELCSALALEGYVSGVYSTDTDNLVYGCPLVIKRPKDGGKVYDPDIRLPVELVETVNIRDVLLALKITHKMFIDLCIIMGCDYNESVPQLGGSRALKLIEKYGSIENFPRLEKDGGDYLDNIKAKCSIPETKKEGDKKLPMFYDLSCLDYEECRKMFQRPRVAPLLKFECFHDENPQEDIIVEQQTAQSFLDSVLDDGEEEQGKPEPQSKEATKKETTKKETTKKETTKKEATKKLFVENPTSEVFSSYEAMNAFLNVKNSLHENGRDILTQYELLDYLPKMIPIYNRLPKFIPRNSISNPEGKRIVIKKK
jgi:flap endonuclease-1